MDKNILYGSGLRLPLLWGALHGINDWVAGFMLAGFGFSHGTREGTLMLIVYAILGFGGQLPVGMWLDGSKAFGMFSKIALGLLAATPVVWMMDAHAGIVMAGLASAFVHVTGGAVCLETTNDKVGPLGIFTAPGVLGLALGSASFGIAPYWLFVPVAIVTVIGFILIYKKSSTPITRAPVSPQVPKEILDSHDWIMLGILLTVTLRSVLYDVVQQVSQHWQEGLLVVGIGAFAGKIIGGFLADRIGWKTWVYITLPLALVLLQLGKNNLYMLSFGIACLQSSVPISLLLMRRSLPMYPATSAAMVLGVGIAIAGLPMYVMDHRYFIQGWDGWAGAGFALVAIVVLFWVMGKKSAVVKR